MEDIVMTFAFLIIAIIAITIRFVIPILLFVIGLMRTRKGKKYGNILMIIGFTYLVISIIVFLISIFKYGF